MLGNLGGEIIDNIIMHDSCTVYVAYIYKQDGGREVFDGGVGSEFIIVGGESCRGRNPLF